MGEGGGGSRDGAEIFFRKMRIVRLFVVGIIYKYIELSLSERER